MIEIQRYMTLDSPNAASRSVEEILEGIEQLADFPESGPVPRDQRLQRLGYRYLARGRYLIFYKVLRSQVRIYRILHQRRAYEAIL